MRGTRETIVRRGVAHRDHEACASQAMGSHPPRVLVAADDQLAGASLGTVLIDAGFELVGDARDCRQAVVETAMVRPDLLVLEIGMPDTDADAVIREFTDQAIAPVVLLTTPSQTGLIEWAVAAGSIAVLVMPFAPSSLLAAVDMVLALHAGQGPQLAEAAGLSRRLEQRNLVEQAKGVLMFRQQMTEGQAYRWLQQAAMQRRVKVTQVAAGVIRRWAD